METWLVLVGPNRLPDQSAHRDSSARPARRAMGRLGRPRVAVDHRKTRAHRGCPRARSGWWRASASTDRGRRRRGRRSRARACEAAGSAPRQVLGDPRLDHEAAVGSQVVCGSGEARHSASWSSRAKIVLTARMTSENCPGGSSRTVAKSPAVVEIRSPPGLWRNSSSISSEPSMPCTVRPRSTSGNARRPVPTPSSRTGPPSASSASRSTRSRCRTHFRRSCRIVGDEAAVLRRVVLSHRPLPIHAPAHGRGRRRREPTIGVAGFGATWPRYAVGYRNTDNRRVTVRRPRARSTRNVDEPERREPRSRPREDRGRRRLAVDRLPQRARRSRPRDRLDAVPAACECPRRQRHNGGYHAETPRAGELVVRLAHPLRPEMRGRRRPPPHEEVERDQLATAGGLGSCGRARGSRTGRRRRTHRSRGTPTADRERAGPVDAARARLSRIRAVSQTRVPRQRRRSSSAAAPRRIGPAAPRAREARQRRSARRRRRSRPFVARARDAGETLPTLPMHRRSSVRRRTCAPTADAAPRCARTTAGRSPSTTSTSAASSRAGAR